MKEGRDEEKEVKHKKYSLRSIVPSVTIDRTWDNELGSVLPELRSFIRGLRSIVRSSVDLEKLV